jgi:hypothetical protein
METVQNIARDKVLIPAFKFHGLKHIVQIFLSPAGVVVFDLIHWQQFLGFVGWDGLAEGIRHLKFVNPGLWIRLTLKIVVAMLNMNPDGYLPVRLTPMNPGTIETFKKVSRRSSDHGPKVLIEAMVRVNQKWLDFLRDHREAFENGTEHMSDFLPPEMKVLLDAIKQAQV